MSSILEGLFSRIVSSVWRTPTKNAHPQTPVLRSCSFTTSHEKKSTGLGQRLRLGGRVKGCVLGLGLGLGLGLVLGSVSNFRIWG